jgi:hypothetical protein
MVNIPQPFAITTIRAILNYSLSDDIAARVNEKLRGILKR